VGEGVKGSIEDGRCIAVLLPKEKRMSVKQPVKKVSVKEF
jgi:hypothetical protein